MRIGTRDPKSEFPMYLPADQYVPQFGSLRRPMAMWLGTCAVALVIVAMVFGAPLALATGFPFVGNSIYRGFSYVCHQIPERSFFLAEHQLAICSRCTGLYLGFTITLLCYPLFKSLRQTTTPERKWLFIATVPMVIDVGLTLFGIWENTHSTRFATGALLGGVAVLYVMPGLMDLALRNWGKRMKPGSQLDNADVPAKLFSNEASAPSDYSAPHRRI
jgi:uncharacterized membrane protein